MLVVTRKVGECIKIGDGIMITLTQIKGKQARIGIDAPGYKVDRDVKSDKIESIHKTIKSMHGKAPRNTEHI